MDGFRRHAEALARQFPGTQVQDGLLVADRNMQAAAVERAIRPEAVALALFALVLAATALLVIGQVAARLLAAGSADNPTLAALGATRAQLMGGRLAEASAAAAAGAVAAAGVAVAVSPLMPVGTARAAEPDPGISADMPVLLVGAIAAFGLLVARAAWPAWRLASYPAPHPRGTTTPSGRPGIARWLPAAPVTMTAGAHLALDSGRGRTAVPVRSALTGTMLSVLAVTAAVTFGANLLHLVNSPRLYGQNWDAAIDLQFGAITPEQTRHLLGKTAGISGWTLGNHGIVSVGGLIVPAIGLTPGQGPLLSPTLLEGHQPRNDHEIMLGTSTLRQIGRHVGEQVTVTVNGHRVRERIVGRATFPDFGQGGFTPTDLGQGALTSIRPLAESAGPGQGFEFVLVKLHVRSAADRGDGQLQAVRRRILPQPPAGAMPGDRPAAQWDHQLHPDRPDPRGARHAARDPRQRPYSGSTSWYPGVTAAASSPSSKPLGCSGARSAPSPPGRSAY